MSAKNATDCCRKSANGFATKAIHVGQENDEDDNMEVVSPIVTSTIFKHYVPGVIKKYEYSRIANPTRDSLQKCLAALDNAKYALTFSSGMGATNAIGELLKSGDHAICGSEVYGGTFEFFQQIIVQHGVEVDIIDISDMDLLRNTIKKNTKLMWFETPTNPCLTVVDIENVTKLCHEQQENIIVIVDNTFLSPYFQRPLELGADIVMYSLTKYMNGHNDVIMGALVTNCDRLYEKLKFIQTAIGNPPSPIDCYQVNRGLKTLALRMEKHQENAMKIAQMLEKHPYIEKVLYPGLPSHPQYDIVLRQQYGHSGMMAFYIKGGHDELTRFFKSFKYFIVTGSLGGYVSTVSVASVMSHKFVSADEKQRIGITDNLIRISVGLEDIDDLIEDLENALKASQSSIKQCIID